MKKLAVLGPKGTFSDVAAKEYLNNINDNNIKYNNMECNYYNSIDDVFKAVGKECDFGIIPIENTLDGYVQRTLDLLLETDVQIISDIIIPISFAFVGNVQDINEVKKVYVQFKSNGQCRKFLSCLNNPSIITTESSMASFNKVEENKDYEGAVIPSHMIDVSCSNLKINNIQDSKNNETRFIVVKPLEAGTFNNIKDKKFKVSLYVLTEEDKPGMLYNILKIFNDNNVNINCILSRPTKESIGNYNFYFELEGDFYKRNEVLGAVSKLSQCYNTKILGIY